MPDLEIFILILGDSPASKNMFSVEAPGSISVSKWRELVHAESGLSGIVARNLTLWKVCPLRFLHCPMC
jgi:hypothetical protein